MIMMDSARIIALFGYETGDGRNDPLWSNPYAFSHATGQWAQMNDEKADKWSRTKRPFTKEEVVQGYWIKASDRGNSFFTKLFPDGTLVEYLLENPKNLWQGRWQLEDGTLRLTIGKYEVDIIANKHGEFHSGIEEVKDQPFSPTYFRCTHVTSE